MNQDPRHPGTTYRLLSDRFAAAADVVAPRLLYAMLGRSTVRIRVVGDAHHALLVARWGHLALDPATPVDATIDLYGSDEAIGDRPGDGFAWGRLIGDGVGRFVHDWRTSSDAVIDCTERRIVARFPDRAALTDDEAAKPLHRLIGGLMSGTGTAMVHAALVGTAERAVLLAGAGGSGKSTTALLCRAAGMAFLGDDYVGVTIASGGIVGHSLYASAMVADPRLVGGGIAASGDLRQDDKRLVPIAAAAARARIIAILLPHVGSDARSTLTPASAGAFVRAAAPYSLIANAQDRGHAMDVMAQAGQMLPVHRLTLGQDLDHVVTTVRGLLDA